MDPNDTDKKAPHTWSGTVRPTAEAIEAARRRPGNQHANDFVGPPPTEGLEEAIAATKARAADKESPRHPDELSAERLRAIRAGQDPTSWEVRKMASEILNARIELVEIEEKQDALESRIRKLTDADYYDTGHTEWLRSVLRGAGLPVSGED